MIASVVVKQKINSNLVFDYRLPPDSKVQKYSVVEVDFSGKNTLAIITDIKSSSTKASKEISKVISTGPVFTNNQITLAEKICDYFITPFGPTLFSFFPSFSKKAIASIKSCDIKQKRFVDNKSELLIMEFDQRVHYIFQNITKDTQNIILLPSVNKIRQTQKKIKRIYPHLPIFTWHSGITPLEKRIIYQKCLTGQDLTIIGSRDTLFLPFANLRNIYIDKPSSYSYFEDQMPHYNAYYVSRLLKSIFKCNFYVGESTPSVTSYLSYRKKLLSITQIKQNRNLQTYDDFHGDLKNPSTQKTLAAILDSSSNILIIGPFKNKFRISCRDCKSEIICNKCRGVFFSPQSQCLNCNTVAPLSCPSCSSAKTTLVGFSKKTILDTLSISEDSAKVTFADLEEIDELPPIFDCALVPYFDSM